jgi:hypothetical protein
MAANNDDWDIPKRPIRCTPLHPATARPGGADPITQRGTMTTPKSLSPAAQAVLNAFDRCGDNWPQALAAALYAAAHHLSHDRRQLTAIATELEGANG